MANKKILFIHSGSDLYGASRCLLRLATGLRKNGDQILAIIPEEGPLVNEFEKNDIDFVIMPDLPVFTRKKIHSVKGIVSLIAGIFTSTRKLLLQIRKFKPDLLHTNTAIILSPGIAAKIASLPHFWHIREFFVDFPNFWKLYQWYIAFFSTRILCMSQEVAKQFAHPIHKKIEVVYDGISMDEFVPVTPLRVSQFREKYGFNPEKLTVGVVGRIKFKRKGQEILVEAAAKLRDEFPNVQYACIGSPFPGNEEHLENLLNLIEKLGLEDRMIYTGDVEDIQTAYAALDILVLTSVQPEPFGMVLIEAMAMGKPVVGTKIGGPLEIIDDGISGFLVEPGNPDDLALALKKLMSDPDLRRKMGQNARARYLKYFEFSKYYRDIQNQYNQVLTKQL
jgi:glycosyltransferase involved in cell wall biosynthesis